MYISPYWFLIAGLFVFLYGNSAVLAGSSGVRYVVAAAFVVLLYVSVLIHELSHPWWPAGSGCRCAGSCSTRWAGSPRSSRSRPRPAVSSWSRRPARCCRSSWPRWATPGAARHHLGGLPGLLVQQLVWANLLVGVFNLLPGLPLDGGRMLRAGVWKASGRPVTATIVAAWAGRVLAVAVLVVPIALLVAAGDQVQIFDVVWFGVIAAFMWTGAGQSLKVTRVRERLPGLQARTLARRAIPIPASLPLAEAIRRADAAGARALVIVDHDDKPIAIVNESAVMATPPQRRPWVDAGSLARTIDPGLVLPADLSGMALLEAVRRSPATEYLLVEPSGQVYGVLSASDLDQAFAGFSLPGRCPGRGAVRLASGPRHATSAEARARRGPATLAGVIRQRRGPFAPGDQVQLTDPKGRKHLLVLAEGRTFHTHRGGLAHDDLIGAPEGTVVKSSGGTPYVALRPLLADFTLSMVPRRRRRLPEGRGPDHRAGRRLPGGPGAGGGSGFGCAVLLAAAQRGGGRAAGLLRAARRTSPTSRGTTSSGSSAGRIRPGSSGSGT